MEAKKFELWNDLSILEKSVIDDSIDNLTNGTIVENIEDLANALNCLVSNSCDIEDCIKSAYYRVYRYLSFNIELLKRVSDSQRED